MLTDKGWITAQAVLVGYWGALRATFEDKRTADFWRSELAAASDEDAIAGIKAYALEETPDFPNLPSILKWVSYATKSRLANKPYLTESPGSAGVGWDGRIIRTLEDWEEAKIDELIKFDQDHPGTIDLGARIAKIREDGPTLKAYRASGLMPATSPI